MTVADVRELLAYNAWANARVFEAVSTLSEEQWTQPVASSFPSVGATAAHMVAAEWIWLRRWLGESPAGFPDWVTAPVLSDLRVQLREIERERDAFVAGLSDRDLTRTITYRRPGGQSSSEPLASLIRHVVNHSTYHRGQVATQLRQLGFTPLSTDLIVFQRQRIANEGGGQSAGSAPMTPDLPAPVPEIPVSRIGAAAAYYVDKLGFALDWGGDDLGLAGLSNGRCRLFLASAAYRGDRGVAGRVTTWLNAESREEVDALHEAWRAAGATLVSGPESKSWGLYEFTAADLDGNLFRVFFDFATPGRGGTGPSS